MEIVAHPPWAQVVANEMQLQIPPETDIGITVNFPPCSQSR